MDPIDISQAIYEAGKEVASASSSDVASVLNQVLNRFLGWPFKAATGYATDSESKKTERFGTIVYSTSDPSTPSETVDVPADVVAAIIDVSDHMDLDNFRAAYGRIAYAKALKKGRAPVVTGVANTTTTLGIIFAVRVTSSLERFAEELDRLNKQTPSAQWPDMVTIISIGTVNYAAHFPGEQIFGDYLPPAQGALTSRVPPIYIVVVLKAAGAYTFNKMMGFLIAHLAIFSPGAKLPNWVEISQGVPKESISFCGYQYNLRGELLPVPRQFYNDRYLPARPVRVEDRKGNLLYTLQFLPWQDGGVIILVGRMPLEGLLIWLGKIALKGGGIIKRDNRQISNVLPITQANFSELLARIQRQSNMVVRNDPAQWVIQKMADEGASSPFMARLFIGIMHLRDAVFPNPADREKFDKAYEVFNSLLSIRTSTQEIVEVWNEHFRKVSEGAIARIQGPTIHIDENIDKELRKRVESFLNVGVRVLKGMQNVAAALKVDIGFLFQKPAPFVRGISSLEQTDLYLAEYLRETRIWSERLIDCRNAVEHKGWILPKATYSRLDTGITVDEPSISGEKVSEFVGTMLDRLTCFVEEVTVHCLQKQMPAVIGIAEIPLSQRENGEIPMRFQVTLATGGNPIWTIAYHSGSFEET